MLKKLLALLFPTTVAVRVDNREIHQWAYLPHFLFGLGLLLVILRAMGWELD